MYNQWTYKYSLLLYTYSEKNYLKYLAKTFPLAVDRAAYFLRSIFYFLLFGNSAKQIKLMGTAFDYKKRYILYPDHVRSDLTDKKFQFKPLNKNVIDHTLFYDLQNTDDFSKNNTKSNYSLFILTRLNHTKNLDWIKNIIKSKNINENRVLIKPHPLNMKELLSIKSNYSIVPNELPLEVLPNFISIKDVYGAPSTSL